MAGDSSLIDEERSRAKAQRRVGQGSRTIERHHIEAHRNVKENPWAVLIDETKSAHERKVIFGETRSNSAASAAENSWTNLHGSFYNATASSNARILDLYAIRQNLVPAPGLLSRRQPPTAGTWLSVGPLATRLAQTIFSILESRWSRFMHSIDKHITKCIFVQNSTIFFFEPWRPEHSIFVHCLVCVRDTDDF